MNSNNLEDLIARENFDPFYAPMSTAAAHLLETLYEGLADDSEKSSIAYHRYLNQCKMDFSLASLARLDDFLIKLKEQKPIQRDQLADDLKIRNFFIVLAAYVGEVFSRARCQTALWFAREEIKNISILTSKFQPASLWFPQEDAIHERILANISLFEQSSFFIVLFSRDKKSITLENIGCFLPAHPVMDMLVGEQTYHLYDYVVNNLKAFDEQIPTDTAIPLVPHVCIDINFKQQLQALKEHQRYYLQMRKPTWIKEDIQDPLFVQLNSLDTLYKEGKVVWAAVVQANQSLFLPRDRNKFSSLGEIIYDPTGRTHIRELLNLAERFGNLKNSAPVDVDQLNHAQRLSNERDAVSGERFPKSLSGLPIQVSSLFFWRKHLPNGLLSQNFLPVLISDKCESVMVLPSRFWPQEFIDVWLSAARKDFNGQDFNLMPNLLEKEENLLPAWTLSTDLTPEYFRSNDLFPKLTDLFPDHVYPENPIKFAKKTSDQPLFDPMTLKWWEMLAAADKATNESEKHRLNEEAKKFRAENFMTFSAMSDGTSKIEAPRSQALSEIKNIEEIYTRSMSKQSRQSILDIDDYAEESWKRSRKTTIAPEYKIIIFIVIALIILKLLRS